MVPTGGAADAQVDAAGEQGGQGAELLGDDQRGVVGQHDAAGPDADAVGGGGHLADHDGGGRTGHARNAVVLGQPVLPVAPPVGMPGQIDGVTEGLADRPAIADRGQVEDRERHVRGHGQVSFSRARSVLNQWDTARWHPCYENACLPRYSRAIVTELSNRSRKEAHGETHSHPESRSRRQRT